VRERERRIVAIINEVVERVVITGVSELVVIGGQLLQALHSYRTEVPVEHSTSTFAPLATKL
jgi:hypothetical protein